MIQINIGRPRITAKKNLEEGETPDVVDRAEALFTRQNFVILAAGIALGIILKQQSDIRVLKSTVNYLQEAIRG